MSDKEIKEYIIKAIEEEIQKSQNSRAHSIDFVFRRLRTRFPDFEFSLSESMKIKVRRRMFSDLEFEYVR